MSRFNINRLLIRFQSNYKTLNGVMIMRYQHVIMEILLLRQAHYQILHNTILFPDVSIPAQTNT